jgi:hypothetical protein
MNDCMHFPDLIRRKVKVQKLSLWLINHHAMKTKVVMEVMALGILNLGTKWREVINFTPRPL